MVMTDDAVVATCEIVSRCLVCASLCLNTCGLQVDVCKQQEAADKDRLASGPYPLQESVDCLGLWLYLCMYELVRV